MMDETSRVWMSADDNKEMLDGKEHLLRRRDDFQLITKHFLDINLALFRSWQGEFEPVNLFRTHKADSENSWCLFSLKLDRHWHNVKSVD